MGCSCVRIVGSLMLLFAVSAVDAANITDVLQNFPNFFILNRILSLTDVAAEINRRSVFTLLAPDDSVLEPVVRALNGTVSVDYVADLLRYHVLLQYLDIPEIKAINASGDLLPTLYKAQSNAAYPTDFLNFTANSASVMIGIPGSESPPNAAVVTNLTQSPFSYSILQINHVLIPRGLQVSAPAPAPAPSLAPAPAPASSPAPIIQLTPGLPPLASSPPAPLTSMPPSGGTAPTPRSPPNSPALSLSASLLHFSAAAMLSFYFLS